MTIKLNELTSVEEEQLPLVWSSLLTALLLQDYVDFEAVESDVEITLSEWNQEDSEQEREAYWAEYIIENSLPNLDVSDELKMKIGNLGRRHASVMSDIYKIASQILSTQAETKEEFDLHIEHLARRFSDMPPWKVFSDLEDCLMQSSLSESDDNWLELN
jgi:hypothetical protein